MSANLGWKCPNCGGCYSPMTPQCYNCTGRTYSGNGTACHSDRKTWTHECMAHTVPQSRDSDQDLDTFILSREQYTISPEGKISPKVDIK